MKIDLTLEEIYIIRRYLEDKVIKKTNKWNKFHRKINTAFKKEMRRRKR